MNKLTRVLAGGLTSVIAISAFAAPAMAVTPATLQETLCDAAAPQIETLTGLVTGALALLTVQDDAVADAQDAMDISTGHVSETGLGYIKALDGIGNERVALADFIADAVDFSNTVTDWVDAVDAHSDTVTKQGLDQVNLNYLEGVCAI